MTAFEILFVALRQTQKNVKIFCTQREIYSLACGSWMEGERCENDNGFKLLGIFIIELLGLCEI
jgi:hypothetical protein